MKETRQATAKRDVHWQALIQSLEDLERRLNVVQQEWKWLTVLIEDHARRLDVLDAKP